MNLLIDEFSKFSAIFVCKYRNLEANTDNSFDNPYKTQYFAFVGSKQQQNNFVWDHKYLNCN